MIRLNDIVVKFGDFTALHSINVHVKEGEFFTFLGPSGCGKTTTLRTITGFIEPAEGSVVVKGRDITRVPIEDRNIGIVFQSYALFPTMTVYDNIAFGLKVKKAKKDEIDRKVREIARKVDLSDEQLKKAVSQLSGGQQQRVAIARALATNPKVLLCDEATSALDPKTTHDILSLIRDINQRLGITVIIITHQMSVVQEICDRVAILENGEVVEEGTVASVFSNPKAAATRRLVFPDSAEDELDLPHDEHRLRVIFNGAPAANTPLIARMAMDKRIAANILYASTRSVGDKIYGHMLLGIPGGDEETHTAMEYLRAAENVVVEEA